MKNPPWVVKGMQLLLWMDATQKYFLCLVFIFKRMNTPFWKSPIITRAFYFKNKVIKLLINHFFLLWPKYKSWSSIIRLGAYQWS
jgi:hypothetical protein